MEQRGKPDCGTSCARVPVCAVCSSPGVFIPHDNFVEQYRAVKNALALGHHEQTEKVLPWITI